MSDLVRNIIRLLLFTLVQVYLLNKLPPLHQFIIPYLYFLFVLWLPFSLSRTGLMLVAFLAGMLLDLFTNTPGLHAAACVLIAYLRPFVVNLLIPRDISQFNYREPSPQAMGWAPYLLYVLILTFFHHFYLVLLEWFSFGNFWRFLIKIFSTTFISMLLIIITELLFPRKLKFRTNTA